ncbi:MAG: LytTR family DNA-binding domain-containing protein [Bryobacteraceae bacterium]|nr:LytTR family DNA-binding domain-containing protein [Bryobacteraceae bacterium]MDW8378382.1 LytTR family DNA-binding domain-containing protein [Bryobacterales bacterium]
MAEPLDTLVVDDEPVARAVLIDELSDLPYVRVVGEAETGKQALAAIEALQPDLLLLDIQMPGGDGFEVIRQLKGPKFPWVIFVTAYDEHALRAFEHGAVDYLLKPVAADRLRAAMDRLWRRHASPRKQAECALRAAELATREPFPFATAEGEDAASPRRLLGRRGEEYFLIPVDEILAFQAEGELVWIYTATGRFMASHSLRALEARLDSQRFYRIHRNALVNLDHVRKLSSLSSQRWLVTLSNQQQLVVSKRQVSALRQLLGI